MKKTLCALAVGATLITPAIAMAADVKIYGRAHVSLDYLDDGKDYNEVGLSSNASRLGFKAEQKLENGMTVFGQIEQQINFASGASDKDDSVNFSARDTFVGLKGDFGQVKVGRFDSPFKAARSPANLFGDQVGDLRNLTRVGDQRFDERNDNTIEYKSPTFAEGFNVAAALSLHKGTTLDKAENGDSIDDTKAYDVALTYKNGPVNAALAYELYEENSSGARDLRSERDAFRLAAAYQATSDLNLVGLVQMAEVDKTPNLDSMVYGVGAEYKLTPKTAIKGHYFYRDVDDNDYNASMIAAGVEHRLDKTVRVYANLATVLNDKKSKLNPWSAARSNNIAGVADENSTGLSLGFRYDF